MNLSSTLPFLIVPVIIGLVIWTAVVQRRRTAANLQKLAGQLGLEFFPARRWLERPRVAGTRRGKFTQIFTYTTGSGKTAKTWSAARVQMAVPGPLHLTLKKRGFATKLSTLFGTRAVTLEDSAFDQAWFMQTNQPEFLRAALLPELREKLIAMRRAGASGTFELKGGEVKYVELGIFADAKRTARFVTVVDLLCDLADVAEVAAEQKSV